MQHEDFQPILDISNNIFNRIKDNEASLSLSDAKTLLIDAGFNRIGHSADAGGLDLTLEQQCQINIIFGQTKLKYRNLFGYTSSLAAYTIDKFANPDQRIHYLDLINQGKIISFALTEPDSGSELIRMKTNYVTTGDTSYNLTGEKRFISNVDVADYFIVFAKKVKGISAFLVQADAIAENNIRLEKTMGQDGISVGNVYFDQAYTTEMIGKEGTGLRMAVKTLRRSRVISAGVAIGMATRALNEAITYTKERDVFKHQLIQAMLADSYTDLYAAQSMLTDACRHEDGADFDLKSSAVNLYSSQMVNRVLDNCVQVLGGCGVMRGHIIEEFYRDARVFRIYEGTDQIQQLNIARKL